MSRDDITKPAWRRSSRCNGATACVEVAPLPDGRVGVRDSKLGDASPVLRFSADEWREFSHFMDADDMGNYLGPVWFGQVGDDRWELGRCDNVDATLTFDDDEAEAFMRGLFRGEFTPERLARAGDGWGVDGAPRVPDGATAGFGGGSVPA